MVFDVKEKEKLVIKLIDIHKHKWVYLIGDGIMHICLKSVVNTINDLLYLFEDNYEMRSIMSEALK